MRNNNSRQEIQELERAQFVKENSSEVASKVSSTSKDCGDDSNEDYKPPLKKKNNNYCRSCEIWVKETVPENPLKTAYCLIYPALIA